MREILRSGDPVLLSFVDSLLREAKLVFHVADRNISAVEGGISAFPARVLVHEADEADARQLLADAGLAHELRPAADTVAVPVRPLRDKPA